MITAVSGHENTAHSASQPLRLWFGLPVAAGQASAAINSRKTHCPKGHPYYGNNLYRHPDGSRKCRACLATRKRYCPSLCRRTGIENEKGN